MRGATWWNQVTGGVPIRGGLAEPGVFPNSSLKAPGPISREKLRQAAASRFEPTKGATDANSPKLWEGALIQVAYGWRHGPRKSNSKGRLILKGTTTAANPAYRFGVQQVDKLRAVNDLKKSLTRGATAIKTPINPPSWGQFVQMRTLFFSEGEARPLSLAKADHADLHKQRPVLRKDELAAVVTLKDPPDVLRYRFVLKSQLYESSVAVLHYDSLSRAIASLACRFLKIHFIG